MSSPLLRWTAPLHPYTNIPLTLLTGVGRSGTTALRESLGRHPDLHSTERENNILYDLLGVAQRNAASPSRRYAMRVDDRGFALAFQQLVLSLLWPSVREHPPARLFAFSNLTPELAAYLTSVFPASRIMLIVRNGIEVVASRMRFESFRHLPFESHAAVWQCTAELARWGEGRPDFLLLRHERFIAPGGASGELSRISEFLGLPDHPACAETLAGTTYHPTSDPAATLATPASGDSIHLRRERWRLWSSAQVQTFTQTCAGAMRYFGYELPWNSSEELKTQQPRSAATTASGLLIEPRQHATDQFLPVASAGQAFPAAGPL